MTNTPERPLLLGTTNKKKANEMRGLLTPLGFRLYTLSDFPTFPEVDETGSTFMENAHIKATEQARHFQMWTIGEDSGLCVPALGGAPGIYSARYSGPGATDATNNALLLERMAGLKGEDRNAYYVSTIALADPTGKIWLQSDGQCHGRMIDQARGEGGFGYDPLFEVIEYHQTFAELGSTVKGVISHRARALTAFLFQLRILLSQVDWPTDASIRRIPASSIT
jgi:XTP/dITP diphosphohydrolase